jgi:hypothetical protein
MTVELTIYCDPSWEDAVATIAGRERLIAAALHYTHLPPGTEVRIEVLSQAGNKEWNVGTAVEVRNEVHWTQNDHPWPGRYITSKELWDRSDWEG